MNPKTKVFYNGNLIHPNQHTNKWYNRFPRSTYKHFKSSLFRIGGLSLLLAIAYTYGQINIAEHIINAETITHTIMQPTDFPILEKIAKCESGYKQFKANGDVIRGKINPSDIGKYQINEYINNDLARKLHFDIFTEQGNHDMAVYLFTHQGTEPWNSSKSCWSK